MGLVTRGLVAWLEKNLQRPLSDWQAATHLGDWLLSQGVALDVAAPMLEAYFGLPYAPLVEGTLVERLDAENNWMIYEAAGSSALFCTRLPTDDERTQVQLDQRPLFLTDALAVQTALLQTVAPQEARTTPAATAVYTVEGFLAAGAQHIDGTIGRILADAVAQGATDVHLYHEGADFMVAFRVGGRLAPYAMLAPAVAESLINKLKLLAEMDIAERRLPQDGHLALGCGTARYHLRLSTLPLHSGEKLVMRILPEAQRFADFSELGLEATQIETMHRLLARQEGLVLITGPTNSGKTTTLYACLRALAAAGALVYTIEDPIEAFIPGVQQMQVNARGDFDFAAGLRGMLRSDPDVMVVGELRDRETVDIAVRTALSGRLVLATLHAGDAHQAVNRLRDLGVSDLLISAVLRAVVNQRLLARVCPRCGGTGLMDGRCCASCMGAGTLGRTGLAEIWELGDADRLAIEAGTSATRLREAALARGFVPRREA
ncbi:MAG: ATPase, T2SS/T4P/T4SS family [Peptococcaceae bacterium]|nr:ATPase, T2SS/T4P/T4SS family [Peptococcaceae bacterium]